MNHWCFIMLCNMTFPLEDINPMPFLGINPHAKQFRLHCCNFADIRLIVFIYLFNQTLSSGNEVCVCPLSYWHSSAVTAADPSYLGRNRSALLIFWYTSDKIYQWQQSWASKTLENKHRYVSNAVNREGCVGKMLVGVRAVSSPSWSAVKRSSTVLLPGFRRNVPSPFSVVGIRCGGVAPYTTVTSAVCISMSVALLLASKKTFYSLSSKRVWLQQHQQQPCWFSGHVELI